MTERKNLHFLREIPSDELNKTSQYYLLDQIQDGLGRYLDVLPDVSIEEKDAIMNCIRRAKEIELKFPFDVELPKNVVKQEYYNALINMKELVVSMEVNLNYMEKNGFKHSLNGFYDHYALWDFAESDLRTFFSIKDDDDE